MQRRSMRAPLAAVALILLWAPLPAAAQSPTVDDYLTGAFSYELVAAAKPTASRGSRTKRASGMSIRQPRPTTRPSASLSSPGTMAST